MKNKKTIILLLLIAIVGVVGLTLAYFANTASITNEFNTKQYGTTVTEVFESPSNWTPGTTTDKTLTVTNSGQVDEAVRVSYTESWTSANSNIEGDLELSQNGNTAAIINWANTSDWTTVTENGTTYKYYNYKLAPGDVTSTLLDSVIFNSAITNESNCTKSETTTGKTVTCTSTGNGYDGATYKLVFKVETVQYDKYGEAWGTSAVIANTSKPTDTQLLLTRAVNFEDASYNDETKGNMFVFNHPSTIQTSELTDYRYIGDAPNNYVYFNCTDDTDTDSCEVWRIIGVFDVERTDPNDSSKTITETRMKIVRGSDFESTMAWNSNNGNANDWSIASLKTYLNETYYESLSETSQSQIDDAVYYLGGRKYGSPTPYYGSTEEIYTSERGTTVYNQNHAVRATSWEGKIALMYPTDMYMTYAKGVNTSCYNNPGRCDVEGLPKTGWIYNTNLLQGQSNPSITWFLSPRAADPWDVLDTQTDGAMGSYQAYRTLGVRPVVYLKSSIQIIDGEGTEQNPYVLQ